MKRTLLLLMLLTPAILFAQETDVELQEILIPTENSPGPKAVRGIISNHGPHLLDVVHVNYRVNGTGTVFTHAIEDMGLEVGASCTFNHNDLWHADDPGNHSLEVWLLAPNGGLDTNNDNNLLEKNISVQEDNPTKYILMEEFTASWCGWCPEGDLLKDSLMTEFPNLLMISMHAEDELATTVTDSLASAMGNGYPCAMFDRVKFDDQYNVAVTLHGNWRDKLLQLVNEPAKVIVSSDNSYNPNTNSLRVNVSANFVNTMQGDFRFNCHLVEKEVISEFGQTNFYDVLEGHPMYQQGNPIDSYRHKNVLREVLGGPWGVEGQIPSVVGPTSTYHYVFETFLPEGSNPEDFHIVSMIQTFDQEQHERQVLNAFPEEITISDSSTATEQPVSTDISLAIHPNPASKSAWLDLHLTKPADIRIALFNAQGKEVMLINDEQLHAGQHRIAIELPEDMANGLYFVKGFTGKKEIAAKLMIYQ